MKPPSAKSGVRSSCEAVATNARRAESSRESWTRMRSNVRASSPSSSSPVSVTGSSNAPCAIRSAACSSRLIRRACKAAAMLPSASAIASATIVAYPSRRSITWTVASVSDSDAEKRTTTPSRRATATSAYCTPRRVMRPRSMAAPPLPRAARSRAAHSGRMRPPPSPHVARVRADRERRRRLREHVSTTTRAFVATEATFAFCCHTIGPAAAEPAPASGAADFSSPFSLASTSRFSSDGRRSDTRRGARRRRSRAAPSASRTRIPPGSLTGRGTGSRRRAR